MKYVILVLVTSTFLAACASTEPRKRFYVDGTENMVSVNWSNASPEGALAEADKHCAKHGKHAQFAGNIQDFTMGFNCVK